MMLLAHHRLRVRQPHKVFVSTFTIHDSQSPITLWHWLDCLAVLPMVVWIAYLSARSHQG
ncbi:hypothetical protein BDW72DRAFT_187381 [Aspergillus terricola var. indicus]